MNYWLLKSEPNTYSFEQLLKQKRTNWDHVRNYQARNFLKLMKKDDLALIYHSGDDKAVVGIAKIVKEAYPDLDAEYGPEGGDWVQVDIAPVSVLKRKIELKEIKATQDLADMMLVKQSRLSCMPITKKHFTIIEKLALKPR